MRKKSIKCLFDSIMWYLVYTLPLLLLLIYWSKTGDVSLSNAMTSAGLGIFESSPIFTCLNGLFGSDGTLPLFTSPDVLVYCSYFVSTFLVHLAVDFVLFIPRICHNWMNNVGGGKDE